MRIYLSYFVTNAKQNALGKDAFFFLPVIGLKYLAESIQLQVSCVKINTEHNATTLNSPQGP